MENIVPLLDTQEKSHVNKAIWHNFPGSGRFASYLDTVASLADYQSR